MKLYEPFDKFLIMKCLLLLSAFLILDVHSSEVCVNTDNSVSAFLLADAKNLCPLQPVTARCVINSTQTSPVLIWGCDGQDGSKKERVILCSSSNVINLNCVEGEVQPTLVSCTCDSSTITSDVTFLATNGSWTLTCTDFSIEESPIQKKFSFGIEDPLTPALTYMLIDKNSSSGNIKINWTSSGIAQYQYIVSVSSLTSNVNFPTSITTINVTLEINVDYRVTVIAERCNSSVRSHTSEPLYIMITPDMTDSPRTAGEVAGIVGGSIGSVGGLLIIIAIVALAIFIYLRKRKQNSGDITLQLIAPREVEPEEIEYPFESVDGRAKKDQESSIEPETGVIRGLCVTDQYIYYSSCKKIVGGTEYSVQIVKKENLKHIISKQTDFEISRGLATDTNGCVYVSDSGRNRIVKYDKELLQCKLMSSRIRNFIPYGIVVAKEHVLVCNSPHNEIHIMDLELKSCNVITCANKHSSRFLNQPTDIAFDGFRFFVTNRSSVAVFHINFNKRRYNVKEIAEMSVGENNDQTFYNLRGICTHGGYLYIAERYKNGRILRLQYEEDPVRLRLVGEIQISGKSPVVIAQHNGDIYYSREDEHSNFEICMIAHGDFKKVD